MARLAALILIFLCASAAWAALSGTIAWRTQQSDAAQRTELGSLWGPAQNQMAPSFGYARSRATIVTAPDASRIRVDLSLEQRRKGLLWYNTYSVDFAGTYTLA